MQKDHLSARERVAGIFWLWVSDGPIDLMYAAGRVTNIEIMREDAGCVRFLGWLPCVVCLSCFDKGGIGLSDPV